MYAKLDTHNASIPGAYSTLHTLILARLHARSAPNLTSLTHVSAERAKPNAFFSVCWWCWFGRQTPYNPFGFCISPANHGLLERRGRGSALTICLPECRESSKGATARAWLGDAHSYSPPRGLRVFS